ncbi:MAG TPA: NUDIX domain-containing protein [Chitinophagaceae bacterium]
MAKRSAGILAYRVQQQNLQVLLVHPGGPFYARKDAGSWSIPKGEFTETENPLAVAIREFEEETGNRIHSDEFIPLQPVRNKSGKEISAWAAEADFEKCFIRSNTFELEWPPNSGKMQEFPEVDRAEWFPLDEAHRRIHPAQQDLLVQLELMIRQRGRGSSSVQKNQR